MVSIYFPFSTKKGMVSFFKTPKNHLAILLIIFLTFFFACSSEDGANQDTAPEVEQLMERVEAFNQAFKEGNVSQLESMITDNYIHTNGNSSPIDKTT